MADYLAVNKICCSLGISISKDIFTSDLLYFASPRGTCRKALHTQCLRYIQAIIKYFPEDTKVSRPHGGFVLWLELNKKVDTFKLRTEAMKHHISVVPGNIFSASCNFSNLLRISFGKPWNDEIDYGLMMFGKLIRKMS